MAKIKVYALTVNVREAEMDVESTGGELLVSALENIQLLEDEVVVDIDVFKSEALEKRNYWMEKM